MIKNKNNCYTISDSEISFLEVRAEKNTDGDWIYCNPGPWLNVTKGTRVGIFYNNFIEKTSILKKNNTLSKTCSILCNAGYAIDLFINGFLTQEMIESIELGVLGTGSDLTSIIKIPQQKDQILGVEINSSFFIVDCLSYKGFTCIDAHNNDLI